MIKITLRAARDSLHLLAVVLAWLIELPELGVRAASQPVSPAARLAQARGGEVALPGMPDLSEPFPADRLTSLKAQTGAAPEYYLPDLRTLPPSDLEIRSLRSGGRELRLGNTIWNSGEGAMELVGEFNPLTRQTRVIQLVSSSNGEIQERFVGEFVFHPTHVHWHFDGLALYELWSLLPNGELDRVVSSSDKVSYCVIDTDPVDRQMPQFSPRRNYSGCGRQKQGLSPGWGDLYKSELDGQSLDLTNVADGYYALKSTTNPERFLYESNYNNNSAVVYLDIRSEYVGVMLLSEIVDKGCAINLLC